MRYYDIAPGIAFCRAFGEGGRRQGQAAASPLIRSDHRAIAAASTWAAIQLSPRRPFASYTKEMRPSS
jgi:hypothetical protein